MAAINQQPEPQLTQDSELPDISEAEKEAIIITYVNKFANEFALLTQSIEPFWVASESGEYVLNDEEYSSICCYKPDHVISTGFLIESSKDSTSLPVKPSDLARMLMDANCWADLFPTIVKEAKILRVLEPGINNGSLQIMYGRMHILSPLVAPQNFVFLRSCKQNPLGTWFIMDVSFYLTQEMQAKFPNCSWRFPSGVLIQSLPNATSKVTWVEHVKVKSDYHPLYKSLLSSARGYGATRWISTLQRMTERSQHSVISGSISSNEYQEGRKHLFALSLRLIRTFCSILSTPGDLDLSDPAKPNIRISVRNNTEPGQHQGIIVAASASIRLPHTVEELFNFLRDENNRPKWDVMNRNCSFKKVANFPTGSHPGNSISTIQSKNVRFLQESSIDLVGAFIIYASVESETTFRTSKDIPLLPSGFLISNDTPGYSLLTMGFQLMPGDSSQQVAANTLDGIIASLINYLQVAFGSHLNASNQNLTAFS